jgi:tripartite-type tricarboxylate transporter receptor subunit TctC
MAKPLKLLSGALLALCAGTATAQPSYPSKTIRMIVPAGPAGGVDTIARLVASPLGAALGQSVVAENRPGAGTLLASELTAKAAPDGHTLLMVTNSHAINATIHRNLRYDPVNDFAFASTVASVPYIVVVHPSVPAKSVKELIALARARPGEINYASGGVGTTPHLSGELLATMGRLKFVHVPYKGEAPALTDIMGGHVPFMFSNVSASNQYVKAGKLRALASTGLKRSPAVPDLPTMAESGLPGFEVVGFFAVLAPAKTPREVVTRLNGEIVKVLDRQDIKQLFTSLALEPGSMTAPQTADYIKAEVGRWGKLIQEAGIK